MYRENVIICTVLVTLLGWWNQEWNGWDI